MADEHGRTLLDERSQRLATIVGVVLGVVDLGLERDDLTEQNRRLRNQITAQQLALGLAGQEFNYVPKKVVAAHYAVKLKR